VGPVAHRLGEVPRVHLPLAWPVRQVQGQEVRVVTVPAHAADRLPELAAGVLEGVHLVLLPRPVARLRHPDVRLVRVLLLAHLPAPAPAPPGPPAPPPPPARSPGPRARAGCGAA